MIFYYAPQTVSVACHIALEETGIAYETRRLDFAAAEQRSDSYLGVNPKGRVPSLETERGILTETPALLVYIAQQAPEAGLLPQDAFEFARMQAFNCYLCATVHVAHAHRLRGSRWVAADDTASITAMQAKVPQTMHECFELIESQYFQGPWTLGEDYSVSDMYLFTICNWLEGDSVDVADFPQVAEFHERMKSRPAVQHVMALHGYK